MADNPYSYMATEEDQNDPWRNYQPWQVNTPTVPTFPTTGTSGDINYGQTPDYQIPGNNNADGTPITYPGGWGAAPRPSGAAGASPFWGATMPTMFADVVTNPTLASRMGFPTTGRAATTTPTTSPPAAAIGSSATNPIAMGSAGGAFGTGVLPTTATGTGTTTTTGTTGTTADPTQRTVTTPQEWAYWNQPDQQLKALQTWAQVYLPYVQAQQNAYQWGNEFDEAQRRYNIETPWRMGLESYNAQLATRQQQMNELLAQDASGQWRQEFQRQSQNDAFAQDLANRELALASERMGRELTLAEQAEVWRQTYQAAQLDIERQQIAAQLEAARYAAFGRGQAPGRFVANWG